MSSSDRASLVFFSTSTEVALRSAADKGRLLAAVSGVQPGAGATRYGPALKLAGSILSESALPRREAILITDFQRGGWQGSDGVRLPDGAVLTPMAITDTGKPNLAIAPVALQQSEFQEQQRIIVTSGAVNHSASAASDVSISLEIGGRAIQTRRLNVAAGGSASTTFDPVTVAERNVRASVRLADDALARDNVFHFVVSPEEPVRVVIAERAGAQRNSSLYLARAVAVSETPRMEVRVRQADSISNDDLSWAAVVILNDAPIAQNTADRLKAFVVGGGGLFVALGERAVWPSSDLLPAVPGPPVDRTRGAAARLGALEYGHPLFEVFRGPRTGDFASARFYGYRSVTAPAASTGVQTLARFDDGQAALVERKAGTGRVLMWTSTLDTGWTDLALKPVFVPFVHRVIRHLGGYQEPKPWRTVGDVVDPGLRAAAPAARAGGPGQTPSRASDISRVAIAPGGQRISLDGDGPEVLELAEQGFYEFRAQGQESDEPVVVASNVNLAESDLASLDPHEIVAAAMGRAGGDSRDGPPPPPTDEAQESAQRVWWYLLFAGLVLLGAETVVANRLTV